MDAHCVFKPRSAKKRQQLDAEVGSRCTPEAHTPSSRRSSQLICSCGSHQPFIS